MAFSSLSSTLYDVGRAIKREIFSILKTNQDDLDNRISSLELGAAKVEIFNFPILNFQSAPTLTGLTYVIADRDFTVVEAKVVIYEKGSASGTLEIDVKKGTSLDDATFSSIFDTQPSLVMASVSDYDESSNAVFNAGQSEITQGDYIRLDLTSIPTGLNKCSVHVYGEVQ